MFSIPDYVLERPLEGLTRYESIERYLIRKTAKILGKRIGRKMNIKGAARYLGIGRMTIYNKAKVFEEAGHPIHEDFYGEESLQEIKIEEKPTEGIPTEEKPIEVNGSLSPASISTKETKLIKTKYKLHGNIQSKNIKTLVEILGVPIDRSVDNSVSFWSKAELEWLYKDAKDAYILKVKKLHTDTNKDSDLEELKKLNIVWNRVSDLINAKINPDKLDNIDIDKEVIKEYIKKCSSLAELIRMIGLSQNSRTYNRLRLFILQNDIKCPYLVNENYVYRGDS